jgi:probable DNA repair protein
MPAAALLSEIPRAELLALLSRPPPGAVAVITPNQRLALALQQEYAADRAAQGLTLWESPDILSWAGFVERAGHDASYCDAAPLPLALTAAQSQALWENLLRASPAGATLLAATDAARLAHEAWQLTRRWRLQPHLRAAILNEDGQAFRDWAPRYESALRRNRLIDAAELADHVLPLLRGGRIRRPQTLVACGFDSFTPQQADFLHGLQQAGSTVLLSAPPAQAARVLRLCCADAEEEIRRAAAWARSRLERGCRRIGVVVPDLAARRAAVVRVFSATMAPDYALPGAPRRTLPFNLSLGSPLADYPLANAALLLLETAGREIEYERLSRVLRSPFIAGAEVERSQRARLDIELRRQAEPVLTLERLQNLAARHGAECPGLVRCLAALAEFRKNRLFGAQSPAQWARAFAEALAAAGFPGERALDSVEYQTLKSWHEVIAQFAALDRVVPRMAHAEALSRLRRLAAQTLFQPESPQVPIQILGVLETSGLSFDALWVMGLDDEHWPPPPRPNPFLPQAVQRAAGLPQSSAAEALASARTITARWCAAAAEVVLSHARQEADHELRPSALIAGIALGEPEVAAFPDFRQAVHARRGCEYLEQDPLPPCAGAARGGTALLRDQSACPFRAAARHRLRAEAPAIPQPGLDALARGTLVHQVLARIWRTLGDSGRLHSIDAGALDALIEGAAQAAVAEMRHLRPSLLRGRFAALEKRRLAALARSWLEEDRKRGHFKVLAVEDRRHMHIGGLDLEARLDRVDETADGRRIILDYKTGKARAGDMLGARPEQPQLPLYLLTTEPEAVALAFAQVRVGRMTYAGLVRDDDLLPGIKAYAGEELPQWTDLVAAWRRDLESIARGFAAGVAAVDPKSHPQTCQYCDLQPLCRIRERLGEPPVGEEPGA